MKFKKAKIKLSKKKKALIVMSFILIAIILLLFFLNLIVNPVIIEASEAKVRSITQSTLSSSVLNAVSNCNTYDKIIQYKFDSNNKISMISVDTYETNILSRTISKTAQAELDTTSRAGVAIHLGAFTGMPILANLGPKINFNLSPIGTVIVSFKSEFTTAGINQTNHKIYVNVQASVYVILPTASPRIDTSTQVLIAECVIIGEVPTTYLQSSYLDEMLNLVPV